MLLPLGFEDDRRDMLGRRDLNLGFFSSADVTELYPTISRNLL